MHAGESGARSSYRVACAPVVEALPKVLLRFCRLRVLIFQLLKANG
jgi:hypothetical protein